MSQLSSRRLRPTAGPGQGLRIAVLALTIVASGAQPAVAATFFVDNRSPSSRDAGPGTEAEPYRTISAAVAARGGPDVTIVVKPGIYPEQITIPASGAPGLPFVVRADGPGVVVDGADDFGSPARWTLLDARLVEGALRVLSEPVWLARDVTWNPAQVFVDGVRLIRAATVPDALPVNSFAWVAGQGLYVNLGGDSPGTRQTRVGRRSHGFNLFSRSWVVIEGFEVAGTEDRGIRLQNGCADVAILRNQVRSANSYGIHTVNGQRIVIDGNEVSDCQYHGIGLTAGASGCVVSNNESYRNADPAIRRANGIHLFGAPDNTLLGNRLHHNQDTGMQFTSGSHNCLAYNNRSWSNGDHGYDHLNASGTIHYHDVAYGNFKDGFSIEGDSPNSRLYNCISVENGLTTGQFNLWVNDLSSIGFVSDYNIFWNSTAQPPVKYVAPLFSALADYQAASGQDLNSRQADPMFANGAAGDFGLRPGSPAIDAAHSGLAGWPAADAMGRERIDDPGVLDTGAGPVTFADIGALEFAPELDSPPVVTTPSPIRDLPGSTISFTVTAADPDGQPIHSLVMVPVKMPDNSGATFTVNASQTEGTFTWTVGEDTGTYQVEFWATNTLTGVGKTVIQIRVRPPNDLTAMGGEAGRSLALSNGFPNPSRGSVEFTLDLPEASPVRWAVYDLQGRVVWSRELMGPAGRSHLRWDGATAARGTAPTGVYLVRAWAGGTQFTRRIVRF